ncbi:MAG: electron transfer flavoprotein subunit beta/FixA family protein [Leucobacter sp.]
MKLVVLVKEVPDTYGDRKLDPETGLADRAASETVIDEIDERALEVALRHADAHPGTEISVVTVAPEGATATIRKTLAMGAHSALHVADETLRGADLGLTAETLAAAVRRVGFDLVIAGNVSTDGSGGVIPAMLAEWLDVPHLTGLGDVEITESEVSGSRAVDGGTQQVAAELPAVISVTEALPEARFPNFKGIVAAKKKPLEVVSLAELGVNGEDLSVPRAIMLTVSERPPRAAGVKIADDGDAGERLAEFLIGNRLV